MRKKLVTVLVTVMTLSLAACGQNGSTENSQQVETKEQQAEVQQSEELLSAEQESEEIQQETIIYEAETLVYENTQLVTQVDYALSVENQEKLQEEIDGMLLGGAYSFEEPLVLHNPYQTNSNAVNFYFSTEVATEISYVIHVEGFEDYSATLHNGAEANLTTNHAYQITGFLPGHTNEVTLIASDGEQVLYEKTFVIELPAEEELQLQITKTSGESTESLTDGLFFVAAKGTNYNGAATLYDNNGVLRSTLAVDGYRSDNMLFTEDSIIYPITSTAIGEFDRLGRMVNRYELGNYSMHHDIAWLEEGNSVLVLVTDAEAGSLEDQLVKVDMETGEVSLLVDFINLLPEVYELAVENRSGAENYLGNESLDWLHLNSIAVMDEDSILVSSRELSAVIKVDNITTEPALGYIIGSDVVFEGTAEVESLLEEIGESVALGGQHSLVYTQIDDSAYYLEFYNNNYFSMDSRTDISAESFPDAGNISEGTNSYYVKYLVDEQAGTYELISSIPVEYSSIMSSVQPYDSNIVISSAFLGVYYEYDSQGTLIARYSFDNGSFCYRTFKFSMNDFWYTK